MLHIFLNKAKRVKNPVIVNLCKMERSALTWQVVVSKISEGGGVGVWWISLFGLNTGSVNRPTKVNLKTLKVYCCLGTDVLWRPAGRTEPGLARLRVWDQAASYLQQLITQIHSWEVYKWAQFHFQWRKQTLRSPTDWKGCSLKHDVSSAFGNCFRNQLLLNLVRLILGN